MDRQIKLPGTVETDRSGEEVVSATLYLGPIEIGYSAPLPEENDNSVTVTYTVNGEKLRLTGKLRPCKNVSENEIITSILFLGPIKIVVIQNVPTEGQEKVPIYVKPEINDEYFQRQDEKRARRRASADGATGEKQTD
jgi:hypothetical protein